MSSNAKIEPLKSYVPDCGGLTYEPSTKKYTLRKGTSVTNSGGETSYTKPGIRQFSLLFCHGHKKYQHFVVLKSLPHNTTSTWPDIAKTLARV